MAFRIYTKKGDLGKTSLIGGTRVSKGSLRIATYGAVDTLNSYMGWVADLQTAEEVRSLLRKIQDRLFTIGSRLACDPQKKIRMQLPGLKEDDIHLLEKAIDNIDKKVPPLRSFILPGGHVAVSACHITRCHCREAERLCVMLNEEEKSTDPLIIPYLNRLSDYLFMLSRYTALQLNVEEVAWKAEK